MTATSEIVLVSEDPDAHQNLIDSVEDLHRQLRRDIGLPYGGFMRRLFEEGAEMAILLEGGAARGIAVFRCHQTTFHGKRFYIDDLVTDEAERGRGYGARLLTWCEELAKARGCTALDLESGVHRPKAHRFYFRQGMTIFTFGFTKDLR